MKYPNRTEEPLNRRQLLTGASAGAIIAVLPPSVKAAPARDSAYTGFADPPPAASPWCYWYWMSDNISKPGITRDLEAMRAVGIGEALLGIISGTAEPGPVHALSEDWWSHVVHAVEEGGRTGVGVSMFNSPGWSQSGGPWVPPEQSMRYIASTELRVTGPQRLRRRLSVPGEHFQDVAINAFPAPAGDGAWLSRATVSAEPWMNDPGRLINGDAARGCTFDESVVGTVSIMEGPSFGSNAPLRKRTPEQVIDFVSTTPFTARSLIITPLPVPLRADIVLEAGDGVTMMQVATLILDRRNAMKSTGPMIFGAVSVAMPAITGTHFRLRFTNIGGEKGCGLAEVRLSAAAVVEHYVEKQLGKMHQTPSPTWQTYRWRLPPEPEDGACVLQPASIVDLRDHLSLDGTLNWDVPAGEWVIVRSGMLPTGVVNAPAPPSATGLEVDKLNRAALRAHFGAYIGNLLRRLPTGKQRQALKRVIADSYEAGPQNWTDDFHVVFRQRYGYDPLPWLPVLTGRVVGSADRSDRFLWDLRRLVADLVASNYVATLRDLSHAHNLGLWLENYGHWGFPAEFLQYGGASERLGAEFWTSGDFSVEANAAVSASVIYGKPIVSSEAFTSGTTWRSTPATLKRRSDWAFGTGVNHLVLHVYIHQPDDSKRPGMNAEFSTEFNRLNTWFFAGKAWLDYIRRCSHLLQQGQHVAEIAYFIGEDAPVMSGVMEPPPPEGSKPVFINAEVIETRLKVRDGRFIVPGGFSFALLVLPPSTTMRPSLLAKLDALAAAGGTIVGPPPTRSPSLADHPAADSRVQAAAKALWQRRDRVFPPTDFAAALRSARIRPSIAPLQGALSDALAWTHRRLTDGDLFFLSNQGDTRLDLALSLATSRGSAQVWDPVTSLVAPLPTVAGSGGRTEARVTLPASGAMFVIVRETSERATAHPTRFDSGMTGAPLLKGCASHMLGTWQLGGEADVPGHWDINFPELVEPHRKFEQLVDWSHHEDPAIRYYSGTATYRIDIDVPSTPGVAWTIALGTVGDLAAVRINGVDCGTAWSEPFEVALRPELRRGRNRLEIDVTNTWNNALLGKHRIGSVAGSRQRPSIAVPTYPSEPQPAGLIGPVTLRRYDWISET